ncbi:MAG: serine hydrolase [Candidatus Latescibacteria bacterium]|nr:serine hydrolase [Candidatus Latescibacterota bacterium]NIM21424.1 serine hydrolase [Candidatus Latescibacterota bacterium]NIM65605.1 serine hydrolase [Candidatus Latescibacterota bacterium]NIO01985.1 serine hydrolase [Candidatus Latescibacterota bacterium]NIO28797.1 serine hydrolase [Candidatus Latescibacterota bacterium]
MRLLKRSPLDRIFLFIILPLCWAGAQATASGETGPVEKMKTYMNRLASFGFHGTVLVAKEGEVLLHSAYGLAQVNTGIRNSTSTVFSTGSVTKQFTAAAVLLLEMDGKLSTGDSISRFFDNVPEDKAGATVHHLLTHTAGLRSQFGPDDESIARDDLTRIILEAPLDSPVGSHYQYSNAGFSMLAAIVEIVSGTGYEAFLRERLFIPSGMHHTGLELLEIDNRLVSHSHNEGLGFPSPLDRPDNCWHLKGNGGILSTTMDMYRWHMTLQGSDLLSEAARKKMFTPYVREYEDGDSFYGYGWVIEEYRPGARMIWHNGGAVPHGWSCAVYHFVDDGAVIIVFANKPIDGRLPVDDIVQNLARILLEGECTMPPEIVEIKAEEFERYQGRYVLPGGGEIIVEVEDKEIRFKPEGQEAVNVLFPSEYEALLPKYNGMTEKLVNAIASGDYGRARAFFDQRVESAEKWLAMIREWWASFSQLGAFLNVRALGTRMGGGAQTYCELEFERGSVIARFFWMMGKCGGMRSNVEPMYKKLLPLSESRLGGYSLANGQVVRAEFSPGGGLTIVTGERRLRATLMQ